MFEAPKTARQADPASEMYRQNIHNITMPYEKL